MTTYFPVFNFEVLITLPDEGILCNGAFSTCSGLEVTMDKKTIRSGGDNGRQVHLAGPVSNGNLTLKRGITDRFDLWTWFERVNLDGERGLRATTKVVMLGVDRQPRATFVLERCLPTKLTMPSLDATSDEVAVEELQIAYESIRLGQNPAAAQTETSVGGGPTDA